MGISDFHAIELQLELTITVELERAIGRAARDDIAHALGGAGHRHMGAIDGSDDGCGSACHCSRVPLKVDVHRQGPTGILDIVTIVTRHFILRNRLSRFFQVTVVEFNILGGNFLSPIAQNDVDDGIDVGNVDFTVPVHVGSHFRHIHKDNLKHRIDIGNVHLLVAIHVARDTRVGGSCGEDRHHHQTCQY